MTDRNIVDLARRVLGADKVGRDLNNAASWDAIELVLENAPALARAVIELTARLDAERFAHANAAMRIKCVKALADEMEGYAVNLAAALNNGHMELEDKHDYIDSFARHLRAALNGENA